MAGRESAKPPVAPGDVVAEKYRIERTLGIGGMGFVMGARHLTLDQPVAIKFLISRQDADDSAERFQREARASASIESDHVCRVFDTGELPSGVPFMVMEYLEGHDLDVELETRGKLPLGEVVDYVLQALDAVASAHAIGVVHRDLKPSNLFLAVRPDRSRRVKVLDFGISKTLSDAHITDTRGIVGTPAYMSPEQAKNSRKTDLRTDIWSLGAILYELLSGQPPYTGETVGEVLALVLAESPRPLRELAPHLPPGMLALVDKCLARDRDQRYQSAGELARALAPFAGNPTYTMLPQSASHITVEVAPLSRPRDSQPIALSPRASAPGQRAAAETVAGWTEGGAVAEKRRRGYVLGGGAALAAALVVVGALVVGLRARARAADLSEGGAASALGSDAPAMLPTVGAPESPPRPGSALASGAPLPVVAASSTAAPTGIARPPGAPAHGTAAATAPPKANPARRTGGKNPLLDSRD